jgi:hypothetical protein
MSVSIATKHLALYGGFLEEYIIQGRGIDQRNERRVHLFA